MYSLATPHDSYIEVQVPNVQQQTGVIDCGLFAIAFAVEVCFENTQVEKVKFKQKLMRSHLRKCLKNKTMTVFPQHTIDLTTKNTTPDIYPIELFCTCRMPDIYDEYMIECTECEKWFHFSCIGLEPGDSTDYWLCSECSL